MGTTLGIGIDVLATDDELAKMPHNSVLLLLTSGEGCSGDQRTCNALCDELGV